MLEYVREYLKINDVENKENYKLKNISTVNIGGAASFVAYPDTEEKAVNLISFLIKNAFRYKIVGRMSNILPPDEEYSGVIIKTDRLNVLKTDGEYVIAGAGALLPRVARMASAGCIGGFEELSGIPGSVGAAVCGNAGAYGRDISDLFVAARCYLTDSGTIQTLNRGDVDFSYRFSSIAKKNCLILSCTLAGKTASRDEIRSRTFHFSDMRRKNQPIDKPSLGSTFKRTKAGVSAGKLIDACGLKGFSIGGAAISEKHAGFVINSGGATASDYLQVAEVAENAVRSRFNVMLEKEIEIL